MALPDKVGPYPVVRKLGEGGMGVVYEVRDPLLGRPLALKLVRALTSTNALDRFWREAEALGRLSHPGIVRIHLTGKAPQGPYLVQELIEGEPLDQAIERGLPAPRRAAELVRDLADALAAVHAAGLLHRDLKPANVLVRADGRPVVIDFGLAWDAHAETLTKTGAALGTPAYMAPEQARGLKSAELDARCDVYGLGAILYELLVGTPPFQGETRFEVFGKLLHMDPTWPAEGRSGVPADLDAVVRRAMAKEREGRYPTAEALRDDLGRFLRGEPVEAARRASSVSSVVLSLRRAVRRRGGLLLAALVLGGGAAAATVALRAGRARARAEGLAPIQTLLDELGPRLDADASDRLLDQARRALADAAAVEDFGPGARHLATTAVAVRGRLDRALLLRAARPLEAAPAAPDLAALTSALVVARTVPVADPPDPDAEGARGLVLLVAGDLPRARTALEAATRGAPPDGYASPAGQRRWRAAWAALGDPAYTLGSEPPPLARGRWSAAAATLLPDAGAAFLDGVQRRSLDQARPATTSPGAESETALLLASLDLDALRRRLDAPQAALLDLLDRLRTLAEPAGPGRVPEALQAEASLLEGELLLRLGWRLAAAEAFARHGRLAVTSGAPPSLLVPLVPLTGSRGARLVPPDLAALAGRARALALGLDAPQAAEAMRLAADRAALAGRTESLDAPAPVELADDLVAEGGAELAAARALGGPARAARLARARRALGLALEAGPVPSAEAQLQAARCEVEALAGDLRAAEAALGRARELEPDGWPTREAEVDLLLAAGRAGEVAAALELALAALDAGSGPARAVQRALAAAELLGRARAALVAARCEVDALAVLDLQSRRADLDRAPGRKRLHGDLAKEARRLKRAELVAAAEQRLSAYAAAEAERRARVKEIPAAGPTLAGQSAGVGVREAIAASPLEAHLYIQNHNGGGRFGAGGFDSLALALELEPAQALSYTLSYGPDSVAPEIAADARASIATFAGPAEPDPTLPHPCDDDLRRAFGALYGLDVGVTLPPATLRACHAAARAFFRRAPDSAAAHVVLARLQVAVGDAAGALETLARAADLPQAEPLEPWLGLHEVLALAALRRTEAAAAALDRLVASRPTSLRAKRLREEPLLRADRDLPGTLYPWAEEAAKALEAPPPRARRPR